jgi:hypothetical protein
MNPTLNQVIIIVVMWLAAAIAAGWSKKTDVGLAAFIFALFATVIVLGVIKG